MKQPNDFSDAVAATLAARIKAMGKTQREVSEASGIPLVTLNRKLSGHRSFSVIEVAAIAAAIGISVTDIALAAEREAPIAA